MKEKTLVKLTVFSAAAFGVLAFICLFMNAVTTGGDNPVTYQGMNLAFGKDLGGISLFGITSETKINFSFLVVLAYFLPLVLAIILCLGQVATKSKTVKFVFGVIAFAGFVASLILIILTTQISTVTYKGSYSGVTTATLAKWSSSFKLAYGSYIAIVADALAICSTGTFVVLQLLKTGKRK